MAETTSLALSHGIITTTTNVPASLDKQKRQCLNDSFTVLWVTTDVIDLTSIEQLRKIINAVHIFHGADECINHLTDIKKEKVFFIISGQLCHKIMPLIHQYSQIKYIYILNLEKQEEIETLSHQYRTIRGIYENISSMYAQMGQDARQYSNSLISMSVLASDTAISVNNNEQEATFMYSRLLKEIFINMETSEDEIQDSKMELCRFLREELNETNANLAVIEEFERDYSSDRAIWWYTRECFLYRLLNKALRIQDTEVLYKLRFFIKDLHFQIKKLNSESKYDSTTITVYRGQGMSNNEFKRLQHNVGGLISIHSFWSTLLEPHKFHHFLFHSMS